jgi:two-component system chemotaxis response regulator CheB
MSAHVQPFAVVVGGSAGSFDPLMKVLSALPRDFALPVVIVLHVAPRKPSLLAHVLGPHCCLPVKEVDDKEAVEPGNVYVAPPNYHLLMEKTGRFSLSVDDLVHFSRPSIDVLFESAADAYGASLVGVLLSGANEDGARGISRIKAAGGTTIVQAPASAQAPTMPEAALRLTQPDYVLPGTDIGGLLARLGAPSLNSKAT